jgi:cytochrome c peroxidase
MTTPVVTHCPAWPGTWGPRVPLALVAGALLLACEPDRMPLSPSRPDLAAGATGGIFLTPDPTGQIATVSTTGAIDPGNPFFQSLGTNGRSCGSCHLQGSAFGLSAQAAQAVFTASGGSDPLFAPVDGANCPSVTPADGAAGHSLVLSHGLIRVALAPPAGAEFTVTAVHDPYGCALTESPAMVSVYRRPLPTVNLRFLSAVMFDGRETIQPLTDKTTFRANLKTDLAHQALAATLGHAQAAVSPTAAQLNAIVNFELALFTAQQVDNSAGQLDAQRATGGPDALVNAPYYPGINDPLGDNPKGTAFDPQAFTLFAPWQKLSGSGRSADARRAVARGQAVFNTHALSITGVAGLNDALGAPFINGTCTTCHDTPNVGNHSRPVPLDIGTSHAASYESDARVLAALGQLSAPDLPVYRVVCTSGPLAGTVRYTSDPGRALISGKCADLERIKGPILRGLAARAPFFHNGAAGTLAEVVEFYNLRFEMGLTTQEKADLVVFLRSL